MSENNQKIIFELKNSVDPGGYIIPTYLRNGSILMQTKERLAKISWEKEGAKVKEKINLDFMRK